MNIRGKYLAYASLLSILAVWLAPSLYAEQACDLTATTLSPLVSGQINYVVRFKMDQNNQIVSPYAVQSTTSASPVSIAPGVGAVQGTSGNISFSGAYISIAFDMSTGKVVQIQQQGVNQSILKSKVACHATNPILESYLLNTTAITVKSLESASQNGQMVGQKTLKLTPYSSGVTQIKLVDTSSVSIVGQFSTTKGAFLAQCQKTVNGATALLSLKVDSGSPTGYSCSFQ